MQKRWTLLIIQNNTLSFSYNTPPLTDSSSWHWGGFLSLPDWIVAAQVHFYASPADPSSNTNTNQVSSHFRETLIRKSITVALTEYIFYQLLSFLQLSHCVYYICYIVHYCSNHHYVLIIPHNALIHYERHFKYSDADALLDDRSSTLK